MLRGSFYLLAHHNACEPPAPPGSVRADTLMCVYLSAFSITITALFESEPEDPLELIEEHKGEDVTLREGDKNTVSLSLSLSLSHTHTHTKSQVHSREVWLKIWIHKQLCHRTHGHMTTRLLL